MKTFLCVSIALCLWAASSRAQTPAANPLIDFPAFLHDARDAELIRASHRLTEDQFLQMMSEPGVVLLDARSEAKFHLRHLQGAVNLSLPDFTAAELARIIPAKNTKVLIYCNNNFLGSPASFPEKAAGASLNLSTFVCLTTYGYMNVYELGPLIDVADSKLPFAGTGAAR